MRCVVLFFCKRLCMYKFFTTGQTFNKQTTVLRHFAYASELAQDSIRRLWTQQACLIQKAASKLSHAPYISNRSLISLLNRLSKAVWYSLRGGWHSSVANRGWLHMHMCVCLYVRARVSEQRGNVMWRVDLPACGHLDVGCFHTHLSYSILAFLILPKLPNYSQYVIQSAQKQYVKVHYALTNAPHKFGWSYSCSSSY